MNKKDFFQAVGEIDDDLLLEAQSAWKRGAVRGTYRFLPLASAAACAVVLLGCAALLAAGTNGRTSPTEPVPPSILAGMGETETTAATEAAGTTDPQTPVRLAFNGARIPVSGTSAMIYLASEDYVPMTYEEALDYFGAALPVTDAVPELALVYPGGGEPFGLYRTEDRGVYFDGNCFRFSDQSGGRSVHIDLRTTFILDPTIQTVAQGPETLAFTRIKGWDLALFRYTGEDGRTCCHTEFFRDGVAWSITASGLSEEELARLLEAVVPEKPQAEGLRRETGTVVWVDSETGDFFDGQTHHYTENHDYVQLALDSGEKRTVWVPGEADRFAVGDRVTVSYTGEPATVGNIWPGQLLEIVKE